MSKAHIEMGIAGGILEEDTEDGNVLKMFMCSWRIFFCSFLFTTPCAPKIPFVLYFIDRPYLHFKAVSYSLQ